MLRIPTMISRTAARSARMAVVPAVGKLLSVRETAMAGSRAMFSEGHPDFAPKTKVATQTPEELRASIDKLVKSHPVFLFMKGTPDRPQCGFSQQVVRILHANGVEFGSANVLASEELRTGVKTYSDWPTFPQLYINGEFVGGCDIVTQMHMQGELTEALDKANIKHGRAN